MKTTRRDFLKAGVTTAGVASGAAATEVVFSADASPEQPVPPARKDDMLYRSLGRTGEQVSALGVGGHHLGDLPTVDEAIRLVHEAVDAGVTFFDNCWEYWNGRAEDWLGRALKGRRDKVFLMTKVCTHGRGTDLALKMLDESLRRLQTDHLDLWQVHGVCLDNEPELAYARGGVREALAKADRQ